MKYLCFKRYSSPDCAWNLLGLSRTCKSQRIQVSHLGWVSSGKHGISYFRFVEDNGDCLTAVQKELEHYISIGMCQNRNILVCSDCKEVVATGLNMFQQSSSTNPFNAWCYDSLTLDVKVLHKWTSCCTIDILDILTGIQKRWKMFYPLHAWLICSPALASSMPAYLAAVILALLQGSKIPASTAFRGNWNRNIFEKWHFLSLQFFHLAHHLALWRVQVSSLALRFSIVTLLKGCNIVKIH